MPFRTHLQTIPAIGYLDRARTVAEPGYNRWLVPPAALAIHLAIGQAYAFSVFNLPLTRVIGITESAPADWKLTTVGWVFSIAIVVLGLSAAIFGKWLEAAGPRKAMFAAAACFGGGFLVSALGVQLHQAWLLCLGYGVLGGIGLGLGYISPVSTLIKWFPDRPGMATGLAIMGFGGGAMVGAPLAEALMGHFRTTTSTGVVETFVALGLIYFSFMMFGVVMVRLPPPGWRPAGSGVSGKNQGRYLSPLSPVLGGEGSGVRGSAAVPVPLTPNPSPPSTGERGGKGSGPSYFLKPPYTPTTEGSPSAAARDLNADEAVMTQQFWLLWLVLFLNVTAGIGLLGQASPMIQEMFPDQVSAAAGAGFVGLLSLFNMVGRICWSSLSDAIGRRNTYTIFFLLGAALYALTPATSRFGVLALFVLSCGIIISMYGGGFATIPAYLRDLFGTAQVGAIHGRLLTAWSAAGIAGPVLVNYIRQYQVEHGVSGVGAYTVTVYLMAALLLVGLVCNLLVRPVEQSPSRTSPIGPDTLPVKTEAFHE